MAVRSAIDDVPGRYTEIFFKTFADSPDNLPVLVSVNVHKAGDRLPIGKNNRSSVIPVKDSIRRFGRSFSSMVTSMRAAPTLSWPRKLFCATKLLVKAKTQNNVIRRFKILFSIM